MWTAKMDRKTQETQTADTSFVVGPDGVSRTRGEHVRVFQRWLTGPGLTPVMTDDELREFIMRSAN